MTSIERLIVSAVNCFNENLDENVMSEIISTIRNNKDSSAPALALLAHKMQSPFEEEALRACLVLERCVAADPPRFVSELGKFKFLNEVIRILNPKYLAEKMTERVKLRCKELLITWKNNLGTREPKIVQAVDLLVEQSVLTADELAAVHLAEPSVPRLAGSPSRGGVSIQASEVVLPRSSSIFAKQANEKEIARLLSSRRPEDLTRANKLIQEAVKRDQERAELRSKRSLELQTTRNKAALLAEMTAQQHTEPTDRECMADLVQTLRQSLASLQLFADQEEDSADSFLGEAIEACDAANAALAEYQRLGRAAASEKEQEGKRAVGGEEASLVQLVETSSANGAPPPVDSMDSLLLLADPVLVPQPSHPAPPAALPPPRPPPAAAAALGDEWECLRSLQVKPTVAKPPPASSSVFEPKPPAPVNEDLFSDLAELGRSKWAPRNDADSKLLLTDDPPSSSPLHGSDWEKSNGLLQAEEAKREETQEDVALVEVGLGEVRAYEGPGPSKCEWSVRGLRLGLHRTGNDRDGLLVLVAVVANEAEAAALSEVSVRFAASQADVRLRQLAASGSVLAAASPFAPAASLSQVLLVAGRPTAPLRLRFQLSFALPNGQLVLEAGDCQLALS